MRRTSRGAGRRRARGWTAVSLLSSLLVQVAMAALGWVFLAAPDGQSVLACLLPWCLLGTGYLVVALVVLTALSRRTGAVEARPLLVRRPARVLTGVMTTTTALVGIGAAFLVLAGKWDPAVAALLQLSGQEAMAAKVIGVWAMLLAWGFLHWGFAQGYYQRYHATPEPTLAFPRTPSPSIVDFAYFSYCIGVSFAVSDVEILGRRIRWRVTCHSVLAFLFNGLIVVLAVNTILGSP
ncbi:DUF1345 domain-containing protein [Leifsonia sp. SIMBA_070]|uniref:DUF1345 domain-containing protein n=1 Tax=Leifsonia sp. SIMBA_070 TaxID=3085810 RepID=UPI0039793DEE